MFSKRVKHYHQWLRSAIPFKAKLGQISSDPVRIQGPSKRPSLGLLYPVSPVKERHQKGGKCKISRVLQSPVPSTQASPKVEASHRLKQAQHFSTRRKVQNGNSRVHQDLPDSRGVGSVDRPVGRLPTHPHPPKLKEIPKVLLQSSGVPVHLPPVRTGHSPPGLYNDCKGSETHGPLKRTQNSRPFQFHLKEHWRYPQSLDNLLPWTETIAAHLDWWQTPANVMKGADLHPKDHSIQLFTDASNEGWGAHLDQNSTKGLWSDREKRLHINVLELKAVSLALRDFKDQCQNQTVLVATDNSTVVAYINKQGGTHSAEMCALLWKIMTWCHHYHITLRARHVPGCLNVMADLLSRSNQVQSTEWSLHPQVFKQICQKWFTPHVDLFATHLNHKLPLYVSPIPDPRAWDIDALNINWNNLTAYAYPPTALLHKVIQKGNAIA